MRVDLAGLRFGGRNLPALLQSAGAECGLVCLAMVAAYHGDDPGLSDLRRRFAPSLRGMSLAQMLSVAERMNLDARAVRIELDELAQLATPCILHWNTNHFVVLKSVRGKRCTVHDPATGARTLTLDEVSRAFTGVAVELAPNARFERSAPAPAVRLRDVTGPVHGLGGALGKILLLSLALQMFAVATPFYLQWTLDQALPTADRELMLLLGLGFLLVVVFQSLLGLLRGWAVVFLSTALGVQWNRRILGHLLRLPIDFFEQRHLGDVVSRMGASQAIRATLSRACVEGVVDGLMALATFAMMLLYSVPLALLTLTAVALYLGLRVLAFRPLRRASEQQVVCAARQQSHLLETLRGMQSIKLASAEEMRRDTWHDLMVRSANRELEVSRLGLGFGGASELAFGVERILVIWVAALAALDGVFTVGMLIAYVAYKEQFTARVTGLIDKGIELRMLGMHCERLADIVLAPAEPLYARPPGPALGAVTRIEVRDLRFGYAQNEPPVIDGCSFSIAGGESVALVGPSGCGKTTLIKLMLGLLQPGGGRIEVNGQDIHGGDVQRSFRAAVAAVMQDDQLFQGSLAENIAFCDPCPDAGKIESAARSAGIHDEIAALPMRYETLVGDLGAALSGGQKQRVILARALYREPQVLFLDEATSHLDVEREHDVNRAIGALHIIRIMVAHRPETIASADRVLHLQDGKVVRETCGRSARLARVVQG
jgi:ATP-binding cassette subfamily B protein RaxB